MRPPSVSPLAVLLLLPALAACAAAPPPPAAPLIVQPVLRPAEAIVLGGFAARAPPRG